MRVSRLVMALCALVPATRAAVQTGAGTARVLRLTQAELASRPLAARRGLRLPDGRAVVAMLERAEATRPGGFTWYGRLEGDPKGSVAYAVQGAAVAGVVRAGGRVYRLRSTATGAVALAEMEAPRIPWCEVETVPAAGGGRATHGAPGGAQALGASGDTVVDVMVLWTPRAEENIGSAAAAQALIDLAVLETNVAFDNSLVALDLRLVHSAPVSYAETGNMALDLARLRDPRDGFMDEVHGWRDQYGADSVSMLVELNTACGRSYNMGSPPSVSFAPNAFSIVYHGCATGVYALAHELGHGWGLDHDRANTQNIPSWPWAYGRQTQNELWYTIMALSPGPGAQRVPYFSNPDVTFMGQVMGVPTSSASSAHNTLALNTNAPIISAFRPTVPLSYCTAGTSADGCRALMSAIGTPSASATSGFTLQVTTAAGAKDGLFFIGTGGRQANSWGSGTSYQCVVPPVFRGGLQGASGTSGQCDGVFSQDWNALWCATCPKPAKNPGAGAVVQGQLWYRDPFNTSNQTTSLSNAVEFVVQP